MLHFLVRRIMKNPIEYPKKISSAEVQAELWNKLNLAGYDARMEVRLKQDGRRGPRLDIVVFKDKEAKVIIECKSWSDSYKIQEHYQKSKNNKQITKYKCQSGLPVYVCGHHNSVEYIMGLVDELFAACDKQG